MLFVNGGAGEATAYSRDIPSFDGVAVAEMINVLMAVSPVL